MSPGMLVIAFHFSPLQVNQFCFPGRTMCPGPMRTIPPPNFIAIGSTVWTRVTNRQTDTHTDRQTDRQTAELRGISIAIWLHNCIPKVAFVATVKGLASEDKYQCRKAVLENLHKSKTRNGSPTLNIVTWIPVILECFIDSPPHRYVITKLTERKPGVIRCVFNIQNALKLTYEHLSNQKHFPGVTPPNPRKEDGVRDRRGGKGREGEGCRGLNQVWEGIDADAG